MLAVVLLPLFIVWLESGTASARLRSKSTSRPVLDPRERSFADETLVIDGDILLGVIASVRDQGRPGRPCGTRLRDTGSVQVVESVVYALQKVNANRDLLPGFTLGAVVVDDCATPVTALTRALQFLPVSRSQPCLHDCRPDGNDREKLMIGQPRRGRGHNPDPPPPLNLYDVVGVIGTESSSSSIMIANLLGIFNIPQISPSATSDLLTDKTHFPYFMRMSPPNRYQVTAMAHLFRHFNWTYISAVYSKGGYGESGVDQLLRAATTYSFCIGATLPVSRSHSSAEVDGLVFSLVKVKARVVVLFTDQEETRILLEAIKRNRLIGRFVFVGSDGVDINLDDLDGLEEAALGILTFNSYMERPTDFYQYFESISPCDNSTRNPWFLQMWTELFRNETDFNEDQFSTTLRTLCDRNLSIHDAEDYNREPSVSLVIDTVQVFALAIDRLVKENCPGSRDAKSIRSCIEGPLLLKYLRNTTFEGENGAVSFDENGDILGRYEVRNFQRFADGKFGAVRVGIWDTQSQRLLEMNDSVIMWNVRGEEERRDMETENDRKMEAVGRRVDLGSESDIYRVTTDNKAGESDAGKKEKATVERTEEENERISGRLGADNHLVAVAVPTSRCGDVCQTGEVYSYFKDTCCWECRRCASNELAAANGTRCIVCPPLHWPFYSDNETGCVPLEPEVTSWRSAVVVLLVILSSVGVIVCFLVLCIYIRHNRHRLIKSTSRELSYLMWSGIVVQYLLVFSILSKPGAIICFVNYVGFNASFAVVYAGLLTRTNRIYRIFREGSKGRTLPALTSSLSQIVIAMGLVLVQVILKSFITSWKLSP